ncbi:unnamed protein product [Porites lobata]|uniref:Uncharacterized protein n=1 Tax=Porites lobata TaxID=104759 RepID=A0ABN8N2C2_9CNID|nr:unnamed protein product [Porites lobata]
MVYSAAPLEVCDEKEIITVRDCSELVDILVYTDGLFSLAMFTLYLITFRVDTKV